MILGVCGFGFSGSGALLDFLHSYECITVADQIELSFIYKPDGLQDLYEAIVLNPVRYFSSDSAIRRFMKYMHRQEKRYNRITNGEFSSLVKRYLDAIVQVSWSGNTTVHYYQDEGLSFVFRQKIARTIRRRIEKNYIINKSCWPDKTMFFSYMDDHLFREYTKDFLKSFIMAVTAKTSSPIIAIDQLFPANNPEKYFWYVGDAKAIVVLRDPRDIYLLAKTSLGMPGRFIPSDNVTDFVKYYNGLMNSRRVINSNNTLTLFFEDLIYDTENITKRIESFLQLSGGKSKDKARFDPRVSINNTQLFRRYPQYKEDVEYIEQELTSFLYDFERFKTKPSSDIKPF